MANATQVWMSSDGGCLQAVCAPTCTYEPLVEETARLINAMASDNQGRSYLLTCAGSVPALIALLRRAAAAPLSSTAGANGVDGAAGNATQDGDQGSVHDRLQQQAPATAPGLGASGPPEPCEDDTAASRSARGAQALSCPDARPLLAAAAQPSALDPQRGSMHASSLGAQQLSAAGASASWPDVAGGGLSSGEASGAQDVRDGVVLQQTLVALQKLSLRRLGQSEMLRHGLLPLLVALLQVGRWKQYSSA